MSLLLELYQLAERDNIEIDCFEMKKREAFSIMDSDGCCYIAIDPFKLTSDQDEVQKLAHELGHCKTGSFYNQYATCDVRQKHESRADKWAIRTIIPEEDFSNAVENGHTEIWDLAEYFDVTEDFMRKAICLYTYGNLAVRLYSPLTSPG